MGGISIQFHGLPEELLPFVKQSVAEYDLHVVAIRFFPFEAIEVTCNELDGIFLESSPYEELAFTLDKPILPVKSNNTFLDNFPEQLRLTICRPSEKGLEQAWLNARTDNVNALPIWKAIAKRLKGITQAGVVAINPETGATAINRSHRFTSGAKALEACGVQMLPLGGGRIFKLGIPLSD